MLVGHIPDDIWKHVLGFLSESSVRESVIRINRRFFRMGFECIGYSLPWQFSPDNFEQHYRILGEMGLGEGVRALRASNLICTAQGQGHTNAHIFTTFKKLLEIRVRGDYISSFVPIAGLHHGSLLTLLEIKDRGQCSDSAHNFIVAAPLLSALVDLHLSMGCWSDVTTAWYSLQPYVTRLQSLALSECGYAKCRDHCTCHDPSPAPLLESLVRLSSSLTRLTMKQKFVSSWDLSSLHTLLSPLRSLKFSGLIDELPPALPSLEDYAGKLRWNSQLQSLLSGSSNLTQLRLCLYEGTDLVLPLRWSSLMRLDLASSYYRLNIQFPTAMGRLRTLKLRQISLGLDFSLDHAPGLTSLWLERCYVSPGHAAQVSSAVARPSRLVDLTIRQVFTASTLSAERWEPRREHLRSLLLTVTDGRGGGEMEFLTGLHRLEKLRLAGFTHTNNVLPVASVVSLTNLAWYLPVAAYGDQSLKLLSRLTNLRVLGLGMSPDAAEKAKLNALLGSLSRLLPFVRPEQVSSYCV